MIYPLALGFLITFFFEKTFAWNTLESGKISYQTIGLSTLGGLSFHSLVEGLAMGTAMKMEIGIVVIAALIIHKFPVALILSSLFIKAGIFKKRTILFIIFLFALITPLGAGVSYVMFGIVDPYLLELAIAASGGTFLYLALFDFLPAINKQNQFGRIHTVSVCMGFSAMYFI
ncbi:MAG: ZIP family metal transporter [Candidatus Nitronauta litoralis]|uniref:ZIP family metal transporter n=1 Tax=Candidatus Nitronauta litoralis TaxID=2705533 RepID=A0A7T0BY46_9BACT|nr:MAG: ZIP family metal transporter [Candidatus Nitronauta litoralis]